MQKSNIACLITLCGTILTIIGASLKIWNLSWCGIGMFGVIATFIIFEAIFNHKIKDV